ncbi:MULTISPECIES: AAA family ATPase [Streptosporangiaceae]|uniref:AAA family ATPase n=1 Tax=Streptosporangiaceae TaxID=2004 RepID=UPI003402F84A
MAGRVTLVCGPPAAGKSTWAEARAGPGDQIVDLDAICRSLGSRSSHDHPRHIKRMAERVRRSLEEQVVDGDGERFVIRCLPSAADREAAAERLGARVVVLAVPADEAIGRAHADGRPDWTEAAIRDWWGRYEPSPVDEFPDT